MAKYIDREAFIEWLTHIPIKDLSDGLGLCRVIMEDDFKKAIKKIPKSIIDDVVRVVRCKDCKHRDPEDKRCDCGCWHNPFTTKDDDFCSYGERKEASEWTR